MSRSFKPDLCCLFGKPVAENPTQPMIEAAFRHHGLDWRYVQFEIEPEALGDAVRGMRAMGFRGGNVTTPHKVAIMKHLDRIAESASLIGAVNCIVRRGHELVGENTDGKGFVQSLRGKTDPSGKNVVILGAGGAARAIAVELALAGAESLLIVNRGRERARELAEWVRSRTGVAGNAVPWAGDFRIPAETDVLINATSIGLFPDVEARIPVERSTLEPRMVIADVIPNPPDTGLLREARVRGCAVLDGLGMLVNQGVTGFKHWTGIDADPGVMRRALEEAFGRSCGRGESR